MLARILVPLDGSVLAERAIPVAARLACASKGELLLLRVYQNISSEFTPELAVEDNTGDAREARAYLARISVRADLAGIPIERVALGGAVARAIRDSVAAYEADTIVMSSHGRSGFTRRALGSVAEHVARHASVPTLILRGEDLAPPSEEPAKDMIWRGYIGLDDSELAARALAPTAQLLRALAGAASAEARLLTVVHHASLVSAMRARVEERDQRIDLADAALQAAAARLESGDLAKYAVRAQWAVVEAADAADTLATVAERPERVHWHTNGANADDDAMPGADEGTRLIALATRGGAGLRRWALGGVTEHVLEGSRLPLLIVPE